MALVDVILARPVQDAHMTAGLFASGQLCPPPADGSALHVHDQMVYGADAKLHPVTLMPLEQGSGAHAPDDQALLVHLPEIERTQGKAAADAMRIKLSGSARRLAIVKQP
jgi:hypothetical protein